MKSQNALIRHPRHPSVDMAFLESARATISVHSSCTLSHTNASIDWIDKSCTPQNTAKYKIFLIIHTLCSIEGRLKTVYYYNE